MANITIGPQRGLRLELWTDAKTHSRLTATMTPDREADVRAVLSVALARAVEILLGRPTREETHEP